MAKVEEKYANALLELSQEAGHLEELLNQAQTIQATLADQDIQNYLAYPETPKQEKKEILTQAFHHQVDQLFINFLNLMVDKSRDDIIFDVLADYIKKANHALGRYEARIVSAVTLSEAETTKIASLLKAKSGQEVKLKLEVDPDVLAGFYILYGDQVFDATLRTELNRLQNNLKREGVANGS